MLPLFITTNERISNDYVMYADTVAPHYFPGGGGFSIYRFNLDCLYLLFKLVQNYWTKSNSDMPLIRYTGCKFKLFRAESTDYIVNYHACQPMIANLDTFNSAQPSIMRLNNRHIILPCKKHNNYRKSYKTIKIPPPAQMTNKWYLQKDLATQPLVMLMASATSLDRFYASSTAQSTTIGFTSLNTNIFNYYNYKIPGTTGYYPKPEKYLFSTKTKLTDYSKTQLGNLVYLGNTKELTLGKSVMESQPQNGTETFTDKWKKYIQQTSDWGNPFHPDYLNLNFPLLVSTLSPTTLITKYTNPQSTTEIGEWITESTLTPLIECRYNPHADNGDNLIFLVPITKQERTEIHLPTDPKMRSNTFPLWLSVWGYLDWERSVLGHTIDTDYQVIIYSKHITPTLEWYIPLDDEFTSGISKYRPPKTSPTVFDQLHWHPKVSFQVSELNNIATAGPGTVKLPKNISAEAHTLYTFYFKLGSCGAPMQEIENPDNIATFNTNNLLPTTSLQSPTYPIEHYLYSFDQRREQITEKAAKRMQKHFGTEKTFSTFTGAASLHPQIQEATSPETSDEETEETTLLQLLEQQRQRQQKFKLRILQLIQNSK